VRDGAGSALPGIISVVTVAPFWFSGFNAVSQTLGERSAGLSARGAADLIILSLAAAWVFYCLVLVSMALVMPRRDLLSHSLPTAAAFQAAFDSARIGQAVLLAALLGLVSTWNALFFSATRILMVLAKDGFVAARFGTLHPRFGTPGLSIIAVALVIPICALLGKGVIGPLLSLFSVVMAGVYTMVCLGLIILRRRDSAPRSLVAVILPYLALGACAVIAAFGMIDPVKAWSEGRVPVELILLAAWTGFGLWLARRSGAPAELR